MAAPRARVRNVFLRLLGVVFVVAFASLAVQARVLWGVRGLLPACLPPVEGPTIFRLWCDDTALVAIAWIGAGVALGLVFLVATRWCLVVCWALYLSYVTVGQDFLSFQWDNLLLESAFFAFFVASWRFDGRTAPPPHPIGVFLMQWLLLRLMVESGAAKLLTGDPSWRDLTAMATYYETAPLPTWIGWWMHQLPLGFHEVTSALTFVIELVLPLCIWAPRRLRLLAFAGIVGFQAFVVSTANYGFFNYLSAALALWMLDDRDLGVRDPSPPPSSLWGTTLAFAASALVLVPVSIVPFVPFLHAPRLMASARPIYRTIDQWRSINAYHLFASMTLVRREPIFEGTADGETWKPYVFRWKPGPVDRAPAFVAPHQPRVDFQLWFLLLSHEGRYAGTLLDRLVHDPDAVASLFAVNPFPDGPPMAVRIAAYRYRFSDRATRVATGAWWTRELEGTTRPLRR